MNSISKCIAIAVISTSMSIVSCGSSGNSPATSSSGQQSSSSGGSGGGSSVGSDGGSSAGSDGGSSGSSSGATGGCGSGTPGAVQTCTSYKSTTIAAIRNPTAPGCYELHQVGLVARTDSPSEPRLYVQDPNGGDFSAILAKCSTTSQHVCSSSVKAKIPQLADSMATGEQISLRGYYSSGKISGFEEFYIEDIVDECTTVPRPAPIALTVADIARAARVPAKWFRRATVDIATTDPLVMYDFSPAELALPGATCPDWEGFGMIPRSAGTAASPGCTGTMNPPGQTSNAQEILVGREFFKQFLFSSDCRCAASAGQRLVTPTSSVSGTVTGYLLLESLPMTTTAFQLFEPAADKSFPIQ